MSLTEYDIMTVIVIVVIVKSAVVLLPIQTSISPSVAKEPRRARSDLVSRVLCGADTLADFAVPLVLLIRILIASRSTRVFAHATIGSMLFVAGLFMYSYTHGYCCYCGCTPSSCDWNACFRCFCNYYECCKYWSHYH